MPKHPNGCMDATTHPVPAVIEFMLDETGSMCSIKSATISGFNDFLTEQRRDQAAGCLLTLTKFDTVGLRTPYVDLDVAMVPELTDATFLPGNGTNLRDTIMVRIEAIKARLSTWDALPPVLLVMMTDGQDNASQHSEEQTRSAIEAVTAQGWTCVYLGTHQGALQTGLRLGFPAGNIKAFEASTTRETMQTLAAATTVFRAAATNTSDFFSQ